MKRLELIHKMSRNELAEYIAKSFEIRPRLKQCRGCQECYKTMGDNSEALKCKDFGIETHEYAHAQDAVDEWNLEMQ